MLFVFMVYDTGPQTGIAGTIPCHEKDALKISQATGCIRIGIRCSPSAMAMGTYLPTFSICHKIQVYHVVL